MKTWKECCDEVGYDQTTCEAPVIEQFWYAYKNGVAQKFKTRDAAMAFSSIIENVKNKDEYNKFWDNRRKLETAAADIWYSSLELEFDYLTPKVFSLCYTKAYEDSHANGYDAVYQTMEDISYFACAILKA